MELDLPINIPGKSRYPPRAAASLANGGDVSFDLTFPDKVQPSSRSLSITLSPSIAGIALRRARLLDKLPLRLRRADYVELPPEHRSAPSHPRPEAERERRRSRAPGKDPRRTRTSSTRSSTKMGDGAGGNRRVAPLHDRLRRRRPSCSFAKAAWHVQVNDDAVTKGVAWLQKDFTALTRNSTPICAPTWRSTRSPSPGPNTAQQISAVYDARAKLTPYGIALLGLALPQTDSRAATLAASLEPGVQQDSEQAWWSSTRDPLLDFSEDASAEATAFAVKFLSRQKPDSPLLPKAALWLMNHRNEGYWWNSTKQTAIVIYGLTDYLRATRELTGNITATVYVNGTPVMTRKLDKIALDESQLAPGANHIRITAQGEGRVYYSTRAQYSSADEKLQKTGTVALNLLRDYFKLAPSKQADRIVYDLNPLNGPVAVGDIVAVRLTVTGSEWKYLMVEDPIPAGTEFIERDSVYELRDKPPWWQYLFTRRELHDDRMALFQTYFPQGQQQYFYLLKVVNPGVFQVSPARVQPMYQPGVMATSESRRLEAK